MGGGNRSSVIHRSHCHIQRLVSYAVCVSYREHCCSSIMCHNLNDYERRGKNTVRDKTSSVTSIHIDNTMTLVNLVFIYLQVGGDKIRQLFATVFVTADGLPSHNARPLSDLVTSSSLWGALGDLDASSSLRLEWKNSLCHKQLLSSLHIPNGSQVNSTPNHRQGGGNSKTGTEWGQLQISGQSGATPDIRTEWGSTKARTALGQFQTFESVNGCNS